MLSNITNCTVFGETIVPRPPITNSRTLLVVIAVLLCIVALSTLFLNAIVVMAVCKSSGHGRKPAWVQRSGNNTRVVKLLMASMAVSDAVVALVIMPVRITEIIHNGEWIFPMFMCKFRSLTSIYLCTVSVYHVMGMAIDRYLAICKPMSYRLLTVKTGCLMAGLFWGVPLFLYLLPIAAKWIFIVKPEKGCEHKRHEHCRTRMHEAYALFGAVISFYIPFLVIYVLYSKVLIEVRKFHKGNQNSASEHRFQKQIKHKSNTIMKDTPIKLNHDAGEKISESNHNSSSSMLKKSTSSKFGEVSEPLACRMSDENKSNFTGTTFRKSGTKRKSTKALLTIGLIVITFTVTWLPFSVFKIIFGFRRDIVFPPWVYNVTVWMGYFNSMLNPILFCLHNGVRSSVKQLLFP